MKLLQSEPIAAATLTTIGIWKTTTFLFGFNLPCFQRMFIKRRLDAWGGEYHIMRFTTISIFYEKSKFMKELRTAEKGICIRLLHQHTSKSPKLYSEMCLRLLTSVCLCQIFKKAYFVEPMQSNEVPTNQQKSDSKHRCSGCHNRCTMNTSNNCCTSDDIKSSIGDPRTLDPRIVNFWTCSEQKPDNHFWDFWWLVTRIQWAIYRGSLLPRAVC